MIELVLPSGAVIPEPGRLLDTFLAEEWPYYDGIDDSDPNRIQPLDIVATLSVNSFLSSATRIRSVHRGLATACDIDHVFPQKVFAKRDLLAAGVLPERVEIVRERRHRVANLQLLEGPVNAEKQATMPRAWAMAKYPDGFTEYLARHDLPDIPESVREFEDFYVARKRRLARRLAEVLGVDIDKSAGLVVPEEDESLADADLDI